MCDTSAMPLILPFAAILFYTAGFYRCWQQHQAIGKNRSYLIFALAALIAHAWVCYQLLVTPTGINLSLICVSNLVAWVLVCVVTIGNLRLPAANLYLLVLPIAVVAVVFATIADRRVAPVESIDTTLLLHILISLAAYSALMMAAVQSILLALQERQLKSPGRPSNRILPPLETMERLLVMMLWVGLILLSASILSGYFFLDDIFQRQVLHHIVLTTLSWAVYVFFLGGRHLFGWRGLTAVRWTLVAFSLLVLGYLGSKFVMEYLI